MIRVIRYLKLTKSPDYFIRVAHFGQEQRPERARLRVFAHVCVNLVETEYFSERWMQGSPATVML